MRIASICRGPISNFRYSQQVLPGDVPGPATGFGIKVQQFLDIVESQPFGLFQSIRQGTSTRASREGRCRPDRKHERQAGQFFPGLAQVKLVRQARGFLADNFVADQELGRVAGAACPTGRSTNSG